MNSIIKYFIVNTFSVSKTSHLIKNGPTKTVCKWLRESMDKTSMQTAVLKAPNEIVFV